MTKSECPKCMTTMRPPDRNIGGGGWTCWECGYEFEDPLPSGPDLWIGRLIFHLMPGPRCVMEPEMTWNYRVIYRVVGGEGIYAIHEVYYDETGVPNGVTEEPSYPMGETWEEFQKDLNSYNLAMLNPVLGYEYFIEQERQRDISEIGT